MNAQDASAVEPDAGQLRDRPRDQARIAARSPSTNDVVDPVDLVPAPWRPRPARAAPGRARPTAWADYPASSSISRRARRRARCAAACAEASARMRCRPIAALSPAAATAAGPAGPSGRAGSRTARPPARPPTAAGSSSAGQLRVEEREAAPGVHEVDLVGEHFGGRGRGGVGEASRNSPYAASTSARSQACSTTWRCVPIAPNGPTNELVTLGQPEVGDHVRAPRPPWPGSGVSHTPGAGEPSPAHASRVRSRCRSCRRDFRHTRPAAPANGRPTAAPARRSRRCGRPRPRAAGGPAR